MRSKLLAEPQPLNMLARANSLVIKTRTIYRLWSVYARMFACLNAEQGLYIGLIVRNMPSGFSNFAYRLWLPKFANQVNGLEATFEHRLTPRIVMLRRYRSFQKRD